MADDKAQEQQQKQQQQQEKTQDHIPMTNQENNNADGDAKQSQPGLLSKIGDPAGTVLGTALRPIGAPLEKGLTGPLGNALGGATRPALGPLLGHADERSELLGGKNKDSYAAGPDRLGGREQTGENPLGLDRSGRWGFEEEGGGGKEGEGKGEGGFF